MLHVGYVKEYWVLFYSVPYGESHLHRVVSFHTEHRYWTVCWNVLRATFPFPLMVVVCFLYWLQKLDYLLKRAESNVPIYKKDLPCSPALGNKFRKSRSLTVFVCFVISNRLNLCFAACFAMLKILILFWHFIDNDSQVRSFKNFRLCVVKMVVMMMLMLHFLDNVPEACKIFQEFQTLHWGDGDGDDDNDAWNRIILELVTEVSKLNTWFRWRQLIWWW